MSKLRIRPRGGARSAVLMLMALAIMATVAGLMAHSYWSHQVAQSPVPLPPNAADAAPPDSGPPGPHHAWGGPDWGRHEWGHHSQWGTHEGGRHEWGHHSYASANNPPDEDVNADRCRRRRGGHRHHGPEPATVTGLTDGALTEQNGEGWSKTVVLNDQTRYWQGWGGPQVGRAQVALGQVVMVREDEQQNGLRAATDVSILEQPDHPAAAPASVSTASMSSEPAPERPSVNTDLALRWLGFGGLMAGLVEAERRRRRRRRQPKE